MSNDLVSLSATQLLQRLREGLSSLEVTKAFVAAIQARDAHVGAYLRFNPDAALEQASALDARRKQGEDVGPLLGLPVAIKDVFCQRGEISSCASRMLENFRSPYDATIVARLRAAGAVLLGRTNMDEFAMGGSTENSAFQKTRNPWDLARTPGGSSGGAAACVAARCAPLSVGTDTGGSVRQPAALCGVTGLKPTYGRVSRYGLVAFASSLDQAGPLAQSAEDVALLLEVLAGHDPLDSTSVDQPVPRYSQSVRQPLSSTPGKPLAGLKIGLLDWGVEHILSPDKEDHRTITPGVNEAYTYAIEELISLGAKCVSVALPHAQYAVATYYVVACSEASSNLARYDGIHYGHRAELEAAGSEESDESPLVRLYRRSRAEGFGPEVKRRIMLGAYALSAGYYEAYYLQALKVRRLIRQDFDEAFKTVDLLAGPITTAPAFKLGEKVDDPLAMYLVDLYTVSANLAGIPALSLPCGFVDGLPVGLQLQGPVFAEDKLLRTAYAYQQATDWHVRLPALCSGAAPA